MRRKSKRALYLVARSASDGQYQADLADHVSSTVAGNPIKLVGICSRTATRPTGAQWMGILLKVQGLTLALGAYPMAVSATSAARNSALTEQGTMSTIHFQAQLLRVRRIVVATAGSWLVFERPCGHMRHKGRLYQWYECLKLVDRETGKLEDNARRY